MFVINNKVYIFRECNYTWKLFMNRYNYIVFTDVTIGLVIVLVNKPDLPYI